jgi:ABC-type amino acid transport substrate-binding protein
MDAFVYDAPVLQYYASGEGKGIVQIAGSKIEPEFYGIALPIDSGMRKEINKTLIDLVSSGAVTEINEKWFGE